MSLLQLSLLGVPEVKHGERLVTFSTRKAQALLIYLAVEDRVHTRKMLSESLWEELDTAHGRAALRATLQELRKLLGDSHSSDECKHLEVTHDTLRFDLTSQCILDLDTIELAYKQIREISGQTNTISDVSRHDLLKNLEQATLLARGPFLENFSLRASQFFDDWTLQQGEHWHKRVHQIFDTLSLLQERTGAVENAIDTVSRWLSYDSLHEEGYRRLMRLRFSQGDRAGALRAFVTCRSILAAKLQIEPEPDTLALAERIRLAPVPRLTKAPVSPLAPPPSSLLDHPFVGRTQEFDALIKHYQRVAIGQAQIVLLKGERGIGKTRLVNEFLHWAQTQGADVLAGQTLQTREQLSYQPLIDALRRRMAHGVPSSDLLSNVWLAELSHVLPELLDRYPDLREPVTTRTLWKNRLCEATTRLFWAYATRRPVIFFLDDVQWADTATLDLLLYLSQRLTEQRAPMLLLFCLNTEIPSDSGPLSTWLVALQRGSLSVTGLQLSRFTKEEVRRFIQSLAWMEVAPDARTSPGSLPLSAALTALTDWLFTRTKGLPFYLVEMFKELLKRNIITASIQEDGRWGLYLKPELLKDYHKGDTEMPGETQAQGTSAESWKDWQEAWKALYETVSRMWPQMQAGSKGQTMFGKPGSFGIPDPMEAWTDWIDAAMENWRKEMDIQELPAPWLEMMEEVCAKMQMEENADSDPIAVLKDWYDTSSEKWSKAFGDAIRTEQFVEAMSYIVESYTSFSSMFRRASEAYFSNLQLPTRSDIARLARLVVNLEEKVDRIEDSLEHIGNDSAQVIAGTSLQRLDARLEQVESKLEKMLTVLEKKG
jgi:polyhydroxyalkanoic acid synthase PhaR subunit